MADERTKPNSGGGKVRRSRLTKPRGEQIPLRTVVEVERSGDWMPVEELRAAALAALEAGNDVSLHLDGIDHLDASALQILLALVAEQKQRGRQLELANTSSHLRQWFDYAGAAEVFFHDGVEAR
jgi:anti-anti-sigma factor